jgi:uncharacterized protein with NAD-binding domain and iron-sulfur cluster
VADRQKVAILGGGVASIVAAFELTSTEELCERYDVTVHQLGWRLGGKCASGRNERHGQRIEEHGLHIWFGFYENAFRVMREAYAALGRRPDAPLATWRDAFKPCDNIILCEQHAGHWHGRSFEAPRNPLTPGDEPTLPHFWEIADNMLEYLLQRWGKVKATPSVAAALAPAQARLPFGVDRLAENIIRGLLHCGARNADQAIAEALRLVGRRRAVGVGGLGEDVARSLVWRALDDFKRWLWRDVVEPHLEDDDLRFFFTMFDAGATMLQGIIEDGLIERGFEAVNDEDLRDWLRRHGAQPITLKEGPFVRALYDMAFAYENGDVTRPAMAAGTAVQDALRLFFTYRGAVSWKMQSGMGDTVFVPFYEVLRRRGVRFEFFHWVSRLGLSSDRRFVEEIEVIPQVQLKGSGYEPLVPVEDPKCPECWPSEPRWDQIVDGEKLRERGNNLEWEANPLRRKPLTLRRGKDKDFDLVVLGISIAALDPICRELIEDVGNPRFRAMIKNSRTVMTQAFQLWLNRPLQRLGWQFNENSIMTAFVEPLDTYANMTHLLPREAWPRELHVEDIAYFCGVLEDRPDETQQGANERVRMQAIAYLNHDVETIWPESATRDGFDWRLLVDQGRGKGPKRFSSQFWQANFQQTERYVLTPPGSVKHRLKANQSGYENLFLAGDWTKTGLDGGCVEAAVMSGMQASRAICGVPAVIVGEDETWLAGDGTGSQPSATGPPPVYVDYGGLATCPSPVDCTNSTLYGFFLKGDRTPLLELCKRVFTCPSEGQVDVRPLTPYVMLTFGNVEKIEPRLEPWSQMGYATERQVALWIPVAVVRRGAAIQLGWFVPYMWVDNPLSLAGGREIYGFNKNWGWIGLPDDRNPAKFTLEAYGGNYNHDQPAGQHPLIKVTAGKRGALVTGEERWDGLAEVVAAAQRTLTDPGTDAADDSQLTLPDTVFGDILTKRGAPQFFLRQFRSIEDGRRATPQQITTSGVTVNKIKGRRLRSTFAFELEHLDSHPIAAEMGVENQSTLVAFELQMDFVLENGTVLWEG